MGCYPTRLLRAVACMDAQSPCSCSLCDTDKLNDISALLSNCGGLSYRVPKASHDEEAESSIKHTVEFSCLESGRSLGSTRRLSPTMLDKACLLLVRQQTDLSAAPPPPPPTCTHTQTHCETVMIYRGKAACTLVMPFCRFHECSMKMSLKVEFGFVLSGTNTWK